MLVDHPLSSIVAEAEGSSLDLEATAPSSPPSSPPSSQAKKLVSPSPASRRQQLSLEQWQKPFSRRSYSAPKLVTPPSPPSPPPASRRPKQPFSFSKRYKLLGVVLAAVSVMLVSLFSVLSLAWVLVGSLAASVLAIWVKQPSSSHTSGMEANSSSAIPTAAAKGLFKFEAHHAQTIPSRIEFVSRALLSSQDMFVSSLLSTSTSCVDMVTLSQFKSHLDLLLKQQGQSLHHVVFDFVGDKQREILLGHFSAVHQDHHHTTTAVGGGVVRKRIVLSDIDDTLLPSLKDCRGFTGGTPYPGVSTFLSQLASGDSEQVAFVTARPAFLRKWTKKEIAKAGFDNGLLLMGSSRSAISPSGMLENKLKQARQMRRLWPECDMVLVGDNGQKDIDLGKALLSEKLVVGVFIHDIYFDGTELPPKTLALEEEKGEEGERAEEEEGLLRELPNGLLLKRTPSLKVLEPSFRAGYRQTECGAVGINLFPSYAAAALMAKREGILDSMQVERVAKACATEFGEVQRKQRLAEYLVRDLGRVVHELDHLEESGKVEFLHFIHEAIRPKSPEAQGSPAHVKRSTSAFSLRRMTSSGTLASSMSSPANRSGHGDQAPLLRVSESLPELNSTSHLAIA
ncbi:hypothetical protein BASA81_009794 [Batrachochytrium salamandrivorans]|nr:hypothetical protein BASA81_009794 [Batrachochytrium salamandrivorans]